LVGNNSFEGENMAELLTEKEVRDLAVGMLENARVGEKREFAKDVEKFVTVYTNRICHGDAFRLEQDAYQEKLECLSNHLHALHPQLFSLSSDEGSSLSDFYDGLKASGQREQDKDDQWLADNPPSLTFVMQEDSGDIEYAAWTLDDRIMIAPKANGKFRLRRTSYYDIQLLKVLMPLVQGEK
jgi:hypothetical protein